MSNNIYCGADKTPKNKTKGTLEQCVAKGQVRRYGLKKTTREEIKEIKVNIPKKGLVKLGTTFKQLERQRAPVFAEMHTLVIRQTHLKNELIKDINRHTGRRLTDDEKTEKKGHIKELEKQLIPIRKQFKIIDEAYQKLQPTIELEE